MNGVAFDHALDHAGAGVDHVVVAHRRAAVAEAKANSFSDRDTAVIAHFADPNTEPVADPLRAVGVAGLKAGCAGADPHVALAARRDQVVVEGCDAVDRRFGQLVVGRDGADVVVG